MDEGSREILVAQKKASQEEGQRGKPIHSDFRVKVSRRLCLPRSRQPAGKRYTFKY